VVVVVVMWWLTVIRYGDVAVMATGAVVVVHGDVVVVVVTRSWWRSWCVGDGGGRGDEVRSFNALIGKVTCLTVRENLDLGEIAEMCLTGLCDFGSLDNIFSTYSGLGSLLWTFAAFSILSSSKYKGTKVAKWLISCKKVNKRRMLFC
jgi:hypothetical protein